MNQTSRKLVLVWLLSMSAMIGCAQPPAPVPAKIPPPQVEPVQPESTAIAAGETQPLNQPEPALAIQQQQPVPKPLPEPVPASAIQPAPAVPESSSLPAPIIPPTLDVTDHDPIYDQTNPDYGVLQQPTQSLTGFPVDRLGRVNWVKAIDRGLVAPRADIAGGVEMELLDQDVLMTDTQAMAHVRFPHDVHTKWLACANCHPKPFVAKAGANPINMDAIFRGQYCGLCHDKVAFSTFICERCHNTPQQ